jgi:signal transduction histidine kinase
VAKLLQSKNSIVVSRIINILEIRRIEIISKIISSFDEYSPNSNLSSLTMPERREWTNYEIEQMIATLTGSEVSGKAPYYALPESIIERGWGLSEIIETYFYVNKKAILPMLWDEFSSNPEDLQSAILTFDLCLLKYTSKITSKVADETNHRLVIEREHSSRIEERYRIAREIHDNLAQTLAVVMYKTSVALSALEDCDKPTQTVQLQEIKELASEAYADSRDALVALRVNISDSANLISLLKSYIEKFETTFKIPIEIQSNEEEILLSVNDMTQLFCIVQEALTNIRRHANASTGEIDIHKSGKGLRIIIRDDGEGFKSVLLDNRSRFGIGIQVMNERAASIGAELTIKSDKQVGTQVKIWIPAKSD